MEIPYSYSPHPPLITTIETAERLPRWANLVIAAAQSTKYFKTHQAEFIVQQLIQKPFVLEAVELNVHKSVSFNIEVKKKIILFYFLLKGDVIFTNQEGCITARAKTNQFFLTQNQPGTYQATYSAGRHTSLMITISKKWIRSATKNFPSLSTEITRFLAGRFLSITMPVIRMDKRLRMLIKKISERRTDSTPVLDALLRLHVARVLEHYNILLESGYGLLAFKTKQYINSNYTNACMEVKFLADHFHITGRTLQNRFRQAFHMTIHDYCTDLRLQLADKLLAEGKMIKDIYDTVGYKDERSLRYAFAQRNKK